MPDDNPVPLVFTVAVSGHRTIDTDKAAALEARIADIFARCTAQLDEQRARNPLDAGRPVTRRFVSGLAEGADQIATRAAQASDGWRCEAILPFARESFLRTFIDPAAGKATLDALITADTPVLELADWTWTGHANDDPDNEYWRARRYVTLGQMLVRQADLLLAIWRGNPPEGRGGTAEVVAEARHAGVPILWIHPDTLDERSFVPELPSPRQIAIGQPEAISTPGGDEAIRAAASDVLLGGDAGRAAAAGAFLVAEKLYHWERRDGKKITGTHAVSYSLLLWWLLLGTGLRSWPFVRARRWRDGASSRHWPPRRWRFLVQEIFFTWDTKLGPEPSDDAPDRRPGIAEATETDLPLRHYMSRADAIATGLGHHYRSAYVTIFLLAATAVALAGAWLLAPAFKPVFVALELLAIGWAIFVWSMSSRRWGHLGGNNKHRRWLDARLVAESLRSAQFLNWVGFGGRRNIEDVAAPEETPASSRPAHKSTPVWAPWVANAVATLAPMPTGEMTPGRIELLALALGNIIGDQETYHKQNSKRLETLHTRLDALGLFWVVLAAAISLSFLAAWYLLGYPSTAESVHPSEAQERLHYFAIAAAFFGSVGPAMGAALATIRYHGDYERFARRSEETAAALTQLGRRAASLAERAGKCHGMIHAGSPPIFEDLLELMLDTQAALDEDLLDWRFAYAARPMPLP